jgi:dihydrolipoamide dehydrogenase
MQHVDVTIIGGGPAGYVCAIRTAQLGLNTVIVESDRLGGECVNWGCIPSKSLITVSKLYDKMKNSEKFGLKVTGVELDFLQMQKFKDDVIDKLVAGIEGLLKGNRVVVIHGEAELVSKNRVVVITKRGREEVETKSIVIATGAKSVQLPGLEFDGQVVIGSRDALGLTSAPKRLMIVGAGAIGLEFGSIYGRLGSSVTVVEMMDQLIPGSDPEIARVVQRKLTGKGVKIYLRSKVTKLTKKDGVAVVDVATPDGSVTLEVDKVLVSVGRKACTDGMNLHGLGVQTDAKGFIITDKKMKTSVEGIYAIGDVRGPPLLAHKASKEGIVAAEVLAGLPSSAEWTVVPESIFSDPEVASAGLTEAKAIAAGHNVKKTRFQFAALGRALSTGESDGFVKIVSKVEDGLVLGVQIVGPEASNLISEAALAIEMGATVADIAHTIHPHPTLSEAIMEAAESAAGTPIHQLRNNGPTPDLGRKEYGKGIKL